MIFQKTKSAGFLANQMARLFASGLHRRIRPLGLAPAQFMTLLELWGEDGQTQSQLIERLDVEQATMANTLARMSRDGLITRNKHPDDGRVQVVNLTGKARELEKPAINAAMAQNEAALAALSDAERRQFIDMMKKVIAAMKQSDPPLA